MSPPAGGDTLCPFMDFKAEWAGSHEAMFYFAILMCDISRCTAAAGFAQLLPAAVLPLGETC